MNLTLSTYRFKKKTYTILIFLSILLFSGCKDQSLPIEETNKNNIQEDSMIIADTDYSCTIDDTDPFYEFTLCFAGDINFDESWETTRFMDSQENGIYDCISKELIDHMLEADFMCLNNEFAYSLNGSPLAGKAYTFRANPNRVDILHNLGVDAVTLANNHVYDYGKQAMLDTFTTLEEAGIPYFGAGRTINEAIAPYYVEINGKTIAYIGASRAEKNKKSPQATKTEPGILRCDDTTLVIDAIKNAKENADFVIVFVHWGTEYSDKLEDVQIKDGHDFIDAGADTVIGAHSHCLQGFEFYKDKPIVYSLGNFWFNKKTLDTMLIELTFTQNDGNEHIHLSMIPALQENCKTSYVSETEKQRKLYDYLESISIHVTIDDNGSILPANP